MAGGIPLFLLLLQFLSTAHGGTLSSSPTPVSITPSHSATKTSTMTPTSSKTGTSSVSGSKTSTPASTPSRSMTASSTPTGSVSPSVASSFSATASPSCSLSPDVLQYTMSLEVTLYVPGGSAALLLSLPIFGQLLREGCSGMTGGQTALISSIDNATTAWRGSGSLPFWPPVSLSSTLVGSGAAANIGDGNGTAAGTPTASSPPTLSGSMTASMSGTVSGTPSVSRSRRGSVSASPSASRVNATTTPSRSASSPPVLGGATGALVHVSLGPWSGVANRSAAEVTADIQFYLSSPEGTEFYFGAFATVYDAVAGTPTLSRGSAVTLVGVDAFETLWPSGTPSGTGTPRGTRDPIVVHPEAAPPAYVATAGTNATVAILSTLAVLMVVAFAVLAVLRIKGYRPDFAAGGGAPSVGGRKAVGVRPRGTPRGQQRGQQLEGGGTGAGGEEEDSAPTPMMDNPLLRYRSSIVSLGGDHAPPF